MKQTQRVGSWSARTSRAVGLLLFAAQPAGASPATAASGAPSEDVYGVHASAPDRIPAFARLYGTTCSTCHIAAPKLNVLGEAFRLNGYQLPETELLVRRDDPLPLGAPPWRELWPRAIWPGELPGLAPLAIRIQSDVVFTRDREAPATLSYEFPHEVYLLAGAPLGESVAVFLEVEWAPDEGVSVVQAKAHFADVVPGLPHRAADLNVGRMSPVLFSFADHQIDQAGRVPFAWQGFALSSLAEGGSGLATPNARALGQSVSALEITGLAGSRLHYGVGLAQSGGGHEEEGAGVGDVYYRLRWKVGGLDYRGRYGAEGQPVLNSGGLLLDRSLTLEHFGYFGDDATPDLPAGDHRALGWAARLLQGTWDVGVGHVRRRYARPFGAPGDDVRVQAWFGKAEHLLYPWLTASLKAEYLDVTVPGGALPAGAYLPDGDRRTVTPGLIFLVRQNIRVVLEAQMILDGDARASLSRRPNTLWARLDLVF